MHRKIMHMPILSGSCASIPTEHSQNRRGIVYERLANSLKRGCLRTSVQNYKLSRPSKHIFLINKAHNFRSTSSSKVIRVDSSSIHQLDPSLVHKLTNPSIYQPINSPTSAISSSISLHKTITRLSSPDAEYRRSHRRNRFTMLSYNRIR